MLTDRGVGTGLAVADVRADCLDGCEWLHLSGYALAHEPMRSAAISLARAAGQRSVRLSVDLSSTAMIESFGAARFRELIDSLDPEIMFGNEAEAALLDDARADRAVAECSLGWWTAGRAGAGLAVWPGGRGRAWRAGQVWLVRLSRAAWVR